MILILIVVMIYAKPRETALVSGLKLGLECIAMEERTQFIQTLCAVYGSTNIRVQPKVTPD